MRPQVTVLEHWVLISGEVEGEDYPLEIIVCRKDIPELIRNLQEAYDGHGPSPVSRVFYNGICIGQGDEE